MLDLSNKSLLITGGAGSFGRKLVEIILQRFPTIKRLIIFSRDEQKHYLLQKYFPAQQYPVLRYVIGDIRDKEKLRRTLHNIDIVIHVAAIKQVPNAEQNPFECIQTNILGSQNLIEACLDTGVQKVVALSTDKAAAPNSLYGATKLCADKLFVAANYLQEPSPTVFSVVRFGNLMGSQGSVIPFFLEKRKEGVLPITHPAMTRFNITMTEGVEVVLFALGNALGGEIFIPKSPSYKIIDLAEAIAPKAEKIVIGIRAGEKIHEDMITSADALTTIDTPLYFITVPYNPWQDYVKQMEIYSRHYQSKPLPEGFTYSSEQNKQWLDIKELQSLMKLHTEDNLTV
jgi:UDP-N-acetylglucosamine 4,6-dehydratase (inverting)